MKLLLALIMAAGLYPASGHVIALDVPQESVIVETTDGNMWAFQSDGVEDWMIGDKVALIFTDNGTPEIYDDEIVTARYTGFEDSAKGLLYVYS